MLAYDNLANPRLSQGNPFQTVLIDKSSSRYFQFSAHHKKSVNTNKNKSIITKKFNLILRGKTNMDCRDPNETLAHTKD